ncbi:MAG: hypothetical protein ABIK47_05225 [candidate division WOR-3 bacterium]
MGAGVAVEDWQHSLKLNPALATNPHRLAGAIVYAQPYGLKGLNCAGVGVKFSLGIFHSVSGLEVLTLNGNNEVDIAAAVALPVAEGWSGGFGIHGLVQHFKDITPDILPSFDLGFLGTIDRFSLGIALQRINSPRFRSGDELFPEFRAGLTWKPAESLLLAIDLEKEREVERILAGTEFQLFEEVVIQGGLETFPFCLRAGLVLQFNWLGINYGYQYHPQMGDTHTVGINCQWK